MRSFEILFENTVVEGRLLEVEIRGHFEVIHDAEDMHALGDFEVLRGDFDEGETGEDIGGGGEHAVEVGSAIEAGVVAEVGGRESRGVNFLELEWEGVVDGVQEFGEMGEVRGGEGEEDEG